MLASIAPASSSSPRRCIDCSGGPHRPRGGPESRRASAGEGDLGEVVGGRQGQQPLTDYPTGNGSKADRLLDKGVPKKVTFDPNTRRAALDILERGSGKCFAAGTPLLTPEGSKFVEDFRPAT